MSADERVTRLIETENDSERKRLLEIRMVGLTRAVGEAEPGEREFCLAAIDEWLDYMMEMQAELTRLREALEEIAEGKGHGPVPWYVNIARAALKETQ